MTTQTIKPTILDKLNPGKTKAAQTSSAKAAPKEAVAAGNSAPASAGQGAGAASAPAGSFVDTLKKMAKKQGSLQQGGAEKSHKTAVVQVGSQLQADASGALTLGQDQALSGQLKSGTAKATKQDKAVAVQLKAETKPAEGSDRLQAVAAVLGQAQVALQGPEGVMTQPNGAAKTKVGEAVQVSAEGVLPAQGLKVTAASPSPVTQPARAAQHDKNPGGSLPQAALKQAGALSPAKLTMKPAGQATAVSESAPVHDLSVPGPGQRAKKTIGSDGMLPMAGLKPAPKTLPNSTQAAEGDPQAQSAAESQQVKGIPQLLTSKPAHPQAGSGLEKKPGQINTQAQPAANGDTLRDAGIASQENPSVSAAAAALAGQQRQAMQDVIPEKGLNLHRLTKDVAKSAPAKSTTGPSLNGVAVPKVAAAMAANEGHVTNSIDPAVPGNIQVSTGEKELFNPAEVKSASLSSTAVTPRDTSASVSGQIFESIQSTLQQGQSRVSIALNPPELGRVSVRFEEQDNQVIGLLEVSQKQTRVEIEQALPQLLHSLQESGVQLKRLDVMLSDQPDHGQPKDQSGNSSSGSYAGQQERQGDEGRSGRAYDYDRPGPEGHWSDMSNSDESSAATNNAINMLV